MNWKDFSLERVGFGLLLLGGYILAMGTLAFYPIPQGNLQLFAQGIGTLGTAVGVIVAAIWKSSQTDKQNSDTLKTLADKVPPPTVEGSNNASNGNNSASNPVDGAGGSVASTPVGEPATAAAGVGGAGKGTAGDGPIAPHSDSDFPTQPPTI
jgi:hypothetical protein